MPDTPDGEDTASGGNGGTGGGNSNIGAGKGPTIRRDPPVSATPSEPKAAPGESTHFRDKVQQRKQMKEGETSINKREEMLQSEKKSWVQRVANTKGGPNPPDKGDDRGR